MELFNEIPVKFIKGKNCITENADALCLGKKALVVTGKRSAVKSGALDDVADALKSSSIEYEIFNEITENPLVSVCRKGGQCAIEANADFIIGIGGGSVMDAAKAIAAFAANPHSDEKMLFEYDKLSAPLPLVLVPTTSGTGSEANPYSVLTIDGELKKRTYNNNSYANVVFLDSKYTFTLNENYTLSTALDAFCHCLESYMSPKATEISMKLSLEGAKRIWSVFSQGLSDLDEDKREMLFYASTCGGAAINTTGTGFPHPMGYNLTLYKDVPHGRACAIFTQRYIEYCEKCDEGARRISEFCEAIGTESDILKKTITLLAQLDFDADLSLTPEEIEDYTEKIKTAANFKNCVYPIGEDEIRLIYKEMFEQKEG